MKEANFKYFVNGVEVDGRKIDWQYTTSITSKDNEIYIFCDKEDKEYVIYNPESSSPHSTFLDMIGGILINRQPKDQAEPSIEEMIREAVEGTPTQAGVKYNSHKAPLDIVQTRQFPKALQALALATAFGNKKYKETDKDFLNFKRVEGGSQTYFDAAARHNANRYETAQDTGLPHLVHAVWNMLAALELTIEECGVDIEAASEEYLKNLHRSE